MTRAAQGRPAVIAHRGASGEAPENTLAAFRRALELGADAVELDVHLSADGVPVVIHESLLDRTTDGRGLVRDYPLDALRRLDAGRWFGERFAGERIPTLAEALEVLRAVRVIVEIKNGPVYYPGIAARVADTVRAVGHRAVTVSSFDHPVLLEVRKAAPDLSTAVLYMGRFTDSLWLARETGADVLQPYWAWITPDLIEAAHAAGRRVEAWTVDEPRHARFVIDLGVDGIITNFPDRIRALLAQRT
ncbi:MAG: glycerophosphodiester phosphodiesterase [Armatimonadota bacterium]|nr:glycerophosphodiester phosphodiesterase [Armatimonadota bacterium]MDR7520016.1 glycerophosphodiester phosphodiesterase [Armatimonadota bacterium]MDR7549221.1 glycerophosphodiester phosphodiesterase [Armatimonadota bacterium]